MTAADEATDTIVNTGNDLNCDNGLFCDGSETCDTLLGCQSGTAPSADDGVGCTDDSCDEGTDAIVNAANDANCDNGLYCDGSETCDAALDCQSGTAPSADDGVGCTDDSCDEGTDAIVNAVNDANCDNGLYCDGSETCDAALDCQPGTAPSADDGVGCTDDSCDELADVVVNAVNHGNCDNNLFCDGAETCDAALDCQPPIAAACEAPLFCDEGTDACVGCLVDGDCDNGLYCDGTETCNAGSCVAGIPPAVDDGVSCTVDSCDEGTDTIVNAPSDALCDNGLFCDGSETCDAALDCQAGTAHPRSTMPWPARTTAATRGRTRSSTRPTTACVTTVSSAMARRPATRSLDCQAGLFRRRPGAAPSADDGVGHQSARTTAATRRRTDRPHVSQ